MEPVNSGLLLLVLVEFYEWDKMSRYDGCSRRWTFVNGANYLRLPCVGTGSTFVNWDRSPQGRLVWGRGDFLKQVGVAQVRLCQPRWTLLNW